MEQADIYGKYVLLDDKTIFDVTKDFKGCTIFRTFAPAEYFIIISYTAGEQTFYFIGCLSSDSLMISEKRLDYSY